MNVNDDRILRELNALSDSFRKMASGGSGLRSLLGSPKASAADAGSPTDVSALAGGAPPPPPAPAAMSSTVAIPEEFSVEEAEKAELEQGMKLAVESAKALDRVAATMAGNDQAALQELQELSSSFKQLASDDLDLWSCFGVTKASDVDVAAQLAPSQPSPPVVAKSTPKSETSTPAQMPPSQPVASQATPKEIEASLAAEEATVEGTPAVAAAA